MLVVIYLVYCGLWFVGGKKGMELIYVLFGSKVKEPKHWCRETARC